VDSVPDPLLFFGSAGNRTMASGSIVSNNDVQGFANSMEQIHSEKWSLDRQRRFLLFDSIKFSINVYIITFTCTLT
jgi:hypothetical protein